MYRGLGPSLLMAVPSTVLYYSLYDTLRARFDSAGKGLSLDCMSREKGGGDLLWHSGRITLQANVV